MNRIFLSLITLSLFISCADLRTKQAKTNPNTSKAIKLIKQMGIAHQIEKWDKISTYTVNLEEEFYGKLGERTTPFPEVKTNFTLNYIPKSFDGQMTFDSGEMQGTTWGLQSWNTYEFENESDPVFKKNKDSYFWLPTYQYFIEFPLRIQEANVFAYAGERMINGKLCDGVLASWNKLKPQKNIDQYLIWIERENKMIYKLEYTIREIFSFIKGAVYFDEYKTYAGIPFPSILPVESNLVKEGYLHQMSIKDIKMNQVSQESLRPGNNLDLSNGKK